MKEKNPAQQGSFSLLQAKFDHMGLFLIMHETVDFI